MYISKRLKQFCDFIGTHKRILDIGCDHGQLELLLCERDPDVQIIASDISEAALNKTEKLVDEQEITDRVSCRCGDGFSVLRDNEPVDAVLIAGIGGYVIAQILEHGGERTGKINDFYFLLNIIN